MKIKSMKEAVKAIRAAIAYIDENHEDDEFPWDDEGVETLMDETTLPGHTITAFLESFADSLEKGGK